MHLQKDKSGAAWNFPVIRTDRLGDDPQKCQADGLNFLLPDGAEMLFDMPDG